MIKGRMSDESEHQRVTVPSSASRAMNVRGRASSLNTVEFNPQTDGFRTAILCTGDASRVWTAGGRGLDLSMRWEWEMIPLERIY